MLVELEKHWNDEQIIVSGLEADFPNVDMVYLPNLVPKEQVDYIFIAREPSMGKWGKTKSEALRKINQGFKNFCLNWEDFIFHYCISNYLTRSYYVTDVSKMAMKVKDANLMRKEFYPRWKDSLINEVNIIGKKNCKIICVGNESRDFIKTTKLNDKLVKTILHYSHEARGYRKDIPLELKERFNNISDSDILDFARNFMTENDIPRAMSNSILYELNTKAGLAESRRKLIYTYYLDFTELNNLENLTDG